jgi:hypothetical protein
VDKTFFQILTALNAFTEETLGELKELSFEWIDLNLQNKGTCGDWPAENTEGIILKAFPNPFQNNGNISVQVKEAQGIKIMVVDMHGRIMMQSSKNVFRGGNNVSLDAAIWPSGVYQVILTTVTGQVYKYRMIKQ